MIILGIETSCDETAASLVLDGTKIISNVVASSQELHIKTGGIIPEIAAREQVKCIIPVIHEAIEEMGNGKLEAGNRSEKWDRPKKSHFSSQNPASRLKLPTSMSGIDAIAVTIGPGLIGSLLVGVETAKTLSFAWQKPIIPVNHVLGHIYANFLQQPIIHNQQLITFPAVVLLASGGHTELLLMRDHGKWQKLGQTRDDAAGECFDKVARLLGLGYPGGPATSAAAEKYEVLSIKYKVNLPRPMIDSDDFDFSFSGLKTAVLRETRKLPKIPKDPKLPNVLAFEVQEAITDVLVAKTIRAAEEYKVKSILLAGGVAANDLLRQKFKVQSSKFKVKFFVPPKNLCTDNAAMIASAAYFNFKPLPWQKITSRPDLEL